MKKFFFLLCACGLCSSFLGCSTTIYPIRGQYETSTQTTTTIAYDQVWNNIIDFFAENNIPIGTLSKDSGLISATNISLPNSVVDVEDKDGNISDQNAWFVLPYFNGFKVVDGRATCTFNVRVRQMEDGTTKIQINLSNLIGYYDIETFNSLSFKKEIIQNTYPRDCKSTGQFEKNLFKLFTK